MAQGFVFKLQSVLDYRGEQVQQAQQMLALEVGTLNNIQSRIDGIDSEIDQVLSNVPETPDGFDLVTAENTQGYIFTLKKKRQMSLSELEQQQRMVQRCQEQLKERVVAQKTLEKLKEKKETEHQVRLDKIESEQLEEVALRQYQGF